MKIPTSAPNHFFGPAISRRDCLGVLAALGLAPWSGAFAEVEQADAAIRALVKDARVRSGRIALELPPLVENGHSVALSVNVQSPMTEQDHVRAVHLFAEGNPLPGILTAYFTPRSGRAVLTSRVRLAQSQRIWAIAVMSDGSFWQTSAETLVTLSACTEER